MILQPLIRELHWLEWQMRTYEDKYGVLSRDFYTAMETGQLADFDDGDSPSFQDFLKWHGLYKIWLNRDQRYRQQIQQQPIARQLHNILIAA